MKTNQELKDADLPRCDWRLLFKVEGVLSPEDILTFDEYFKHFVPPGPCIKCGCTQGSASPIDFLLGGAKFQWGLIHGEGFCSTEECGWPARAIHYNVGPIKSMHLILQYHPDDVSWKNRED
jgi:hypothetical protein